MLTSARPQVPSTPGTGLRLACCLASYSSLKLSWCTQAKRESTRVMQPQKNVDEIWVLDSSCRGRRVILSQK